MKAHLVAVDWGTSSFRARTVRPDFKTIGEVSTDEGILNAKGRFEEVLRTNLNALPGYTADLPLILSGMIGSRNGWIEAQYVELPAKLEDLSQAVACLEVEGLGPIRLIPGIKSVGTNADVMRGEETELFGALHMLSLTNAIMIIPGTHSKHVEVRNGAVTAFRTYMTGDIFHALTAATILGAFGKSACEQSCNWFDEGVRAGATSGGPGSLLNRLFTARSRVLVDQLPCEHATCYLSGLLIGAELSQALEFTSQTSEVVWILGNGKLPETYQRALSVLGGTSKIVPPGGAVHGAVQIARYLNLVALEDQ